MVEQQEPQDRIARVARAWVGRYAWQLTAVARLTALVQQRLPASGLPLAGDAEIERLCKEEASAELFDACVRGRLRSATAADRERQERAYQDLGNYLAAIAQHLQPAPQTTWQDLVQDTLLTVDQNHRLCKQPAAFLDWAATILRRKKADTWREFHEEIALDADTDRPAAESPPALTARHVDPLGDQELFRILHDCLDTDEERTLALTIMLGIKRRELGMLLDAPLARWDRVRMTVKQKLAACAEFRHLFGEEAIKQ